MRRPLGRRILVGVDERLPGGNAGGAVLVDGTVRRGAGPWTPAVHALLDHLHGKGFTAAPRALGLDDQGREVLAHLPGLTVGDARPWPPWVHGDAALVQFGVWLPAYHAAVADGHNDAAPYNAVWTTAHSDPADDGRLVGFIDWDSAGPCSPLWDLAFVAFSWVPLHARDVVRAEGFTAFADRPRRLRLLVRDGVADGLDRALAQLATDRPTFRL